MTVDIVSPKQDLMFDGEYDPAVADENDAKYRLKCDSCGHQTIGTHWDLHELGWSYEMTLDTETLEIRESAAECPQCQGFPANEDGELQPHEKAEQDPAQTQLGDTR